MVKLEFAPGKHSDKEGLRERLPLHQTHDAWSLFYRMHESLVAKGFNPIPLNSTLLEPNEVIYNRAIGQHGDIFSKSNYFVFVRIGEEKIQVLHSDPGTSTDAVGLGPKQIHRLYESGKDSQKFVDEVIAGVEQCSAKKPEGKYFFVGHGHWGNIAGRDLVDLNMDDGVSGEKAIIRQMMFYNIDLDGTGHHNNYLCANEGGMLNLWQGIGAIEAGAGIARVPSVELTMPSGPGSRNGAHHNLWFASDDAAAEYHIRTLVDKYNKYCVYAPMADPRMLKKYHKQLQDEMLLAVGIAHPAAGGAGIGLLNRVNDDLHLDAAIEYVKDYADGIGAFNLDITSSNKLVLDNPSEMKELLSIMQKWGCGKKPIVNAINMAFASEMKERYGKFAYADHDIHDYAEVEFKYSINGLGKIYNVVDFGSALVAKPGAQDIVRLMRSSAAADRITPFIPYDSKEGELVDSRDYLTLPDRISEAYIGVKRVLEAAPKIWDALKQQVGALYK